MSHQSKPHHGTAPHSMASDQTEVRSEVEQAIGSLKADAALLKSLVPLLTFASTPKALELAVKNLNSAIAILDQEVHSNGPTGNTGVSHGPGGTPP